MTYSEVLSGLCLKELEQYESRSPDQHLNLLWTKQDLTHLIVGFDDLDLWALEPACKTWRREKLLPLQPRSSCSQHAA